MKTWLLKNWKELAWDVPFGIMFLGVCIFFYKVSPVIVIESLHAQLMPWGQVAVIIGMTGLAAVCMAFLIATVATLAPKPDEKESSTC